jgi:hypothetical protein
MKRSRQDNPLDVDSTAPEASAADIPNDPPQVDPPPPPVDPPVQVAKAPTVRGQIQYTFTDLEIATSHAGIEGVAMKAAEMLLELSKGPVGLQKYVTINIVTSDEL